MAYFIFAGPWTTPFRYSNSILSPLAANSVAGPVNLLSWTISIERPNYYQTILEIGCLEQNVVGLAVNSVVWPANLLSLTISVERTNRLFRNISVAGIFN